MIVPGVILSLLGCIKGYLKFYLFMPKDPLHYIGQHSLLQSLPPMPQV